MELLLKQRLVGAAVIIALAVIVLPMIFQGKGQQGIREIPEMPEVRGPANKGIIREQPVPDAGERPSIVGRGPDRTARKHERVSDGKVRARTSGKVERSPARPSAPSKSTDKPASKPVAKSTAGSAVQPAAKASPSNPSWVIQVGSFSTRSRALAVRDRLRGMKLHAFVDVLTRQGTARLYRVRIGPFAVRRQAQQALKRLRRNKDYAKSFITSHP